MNIQRFTGATSREALAKARMAFGDGTLILSNRPTANGVEVVATAEDSLSTLDQGHDNTPPQQQPQRQGARAPMRERALERADALAMDQTPVEQDTEQLAMSTLSFQDYVRERMLRRRAEALDGGTEEVLPEPRPSARPAQHQAASTARNEFQAPKPAVSHTPAPRAQHQIPYIQSSSTPKAKPAVQQASAAAAPSQGIVDELQSMKEMIEERFNTLAWLGQARQDPIQSNLMLKLIRAGYSPSLARAMLERMPENLDATSAVRWVMDVLERNLRTDALGQPLYEEGGIYALVGATGVGKTTTAAKLAAHCVKMHGAASVGLITLDTYRIAAHEQLRTYGRMLGVVAHLAHDRAALQDLLNLLSGKKMVLIDTTGIAPRDPRKRDMLDVLDLPRVNRLLVLNAGGHGDTLDDVLTSFKTSGVQQAILSKVDEAVKLGPALDAIIRHQLVLRGICNGQRVPEDWAQADAPQLVRSSMRTNIKSAFDPQPLDLNFFFSAATDTTDHKERAHA